MDLLETGGLGITSPRSECLGVTPELGEIWPEVEVPLRRYLAGQGASRHDIDDLVQQAAERVLQRQVSFVDAADLRRFCFVVARNLWIDQLRHRASRHGELDSSVPHADRGADDAFVQIEDRLVLTSIVAEIARLPAEDRRALLERSHHREERNRLAVRRYRIRKRLLLRVGPIGGCAGVLAGARRRILGPGLATASAAPMALLLTLVAPIGATTLPTAIDNSPSYARAIETRALVASGGPTSAHMATASPRADKGRVSATEPEAKAGTSTALRGPGNSHVRVETQPNDGKQDLVCLKGDVVKHFCVSQPPKGGPDPGERVRGARVATNLSPAGV